ncbi:uncharacterized protein [Battus philenor]|uniref:uncharacterized protein n=1 Tax=Battus philenor TaxID=42288 RepID=UPI0035D06D60
MWKLLIFAVALAQSAPAPTLYGEFKSIYTWPELNHHIENCSPLEISRNTEEAPDTCKCGRQSAKLSLVDVTIRSRSYTVLADVVSSLEELNVASEDTCSCTHVSFEHNIVLQINDNFVLHNDVNRSRLYLLGKVTPSAQELETLIDGLGMKGKVIIDNTLWSDTFVFTRCGILDETFRSFPDTTHATCRRGTGTEYIITVSMHRAASCKPRSRTLRCLQPGTCRA